MEKEEVNKYLKKIETELKLGDCSKNTIKTYTFFLRPFLEKIEDPKKTSLDEVKTYLADLIDRYSNKSRRLITSSIRFFFKRIVNRPEIYVELSVPKKGRKIPAVLSKKEVKRLIESTKNKKTKLIIKFLYCSGLRVSELVNLKKEDMDLNQNAGWVRDGKGAKDRLFKISGSISKELKYHIERNPENKYLFSKDKPLSTRNVQYLIKKASEKAGINKNVTPHTLRHSFATHLLDNGENLAVIQQLLGHENLETTRIYTHISQRQIKNIRNPLDNL